MSKMQKAKETASNIAASAKSGMDKSKAIVQEKVEKMTAHDPVQKERATEKKEAKIQEAELNKQETREYNAASRHMGGATGGPPAGCHHHVSDMHDTEHQATAGHQLSDAYGTGHQATTGGHHTSDVIGAGHPTIQPTEGQYISDMLPNGGAKGSLRTRGP